MKHLFKQVIVILALLMLTTQAYSQIITPFTVKKQITQKGGIVFLANSAIHCNANPLTAGGTCQTGANQVPPSGTYKDDNVDPRYVDIDGDASTFMSSSDSLNLPTCSEISWVGLFWGASTSGVTTGFQNIKIKANSGAYATVTASQSQTNGVGFNTYHCFADVTSFVKAAGIKARFTVANVYSDMAGTNNQNNFGSWTMVVMYKNDLLTMRQLTCFTGLAVITSGGSSSTVNIPISGFLTPTSGPVTFETGVYVHDGDRGSTGDNLSFNGGSGFVAITDAVNSSGDVMNSTVSNNGALTPFRKPSLNNTLGLDADIYVPNNTTKNYIGNSVTSATFQLTTGGETYLPQMITTAIDVYEPDLRASVKVRDVNGGNAVPGDILEYRVKGINIGSDPSLNSYITDTLEQNANYVPNSIKIIYGPNLGAKTDATGDDQADYTAANRTIKVRIGSGATAATGGQVNNSSAGTDSTVFTYSVTVTNSCTKIACDNVIDNRAFIQGRGAVSTNTFSNGSNPGIFDAFGCPIPGTTSTPITATACATPTANASSSTVCAGNTFTLNTNTDPDATYLWQGPNSFTSSAQNPILGPSTTSMTGTYTVTLSAYTGCSRTATTSVTINAAPSLTATSSSAAICSSTTGTLTASGASTYTWDPGAISGASVVVTPTATTVYTVTGTNALSCTSTRTLNLTVNTTPTVSATSSSSMICSGATATLTSSGATTYTWMPGTLTGTSVAVTPTATTVYTVTGTTGSCSSISTLTLTVNSVPSLTVAATPTAICAGGTSSLTASGASTYTWNPGNLSGSTVTVSPSGTQIYTVTGSSAAGCVNTRTVSLTVNSVPSLTVTAGTPAGICSGSTGTLNASGAASYTWNPGNLSGSSVTVTPTSTQNYTVTGLNASGCVNTQTVTLNVTTSPTVGATAIPSALCSGQTGTLSASGASSYTWTPGGSNSASITVTQSATTVYTVTGANGICVSTQTISVPLNNCPAAVNDATNTIQNTPVSGNASTNDNNSSGGTFTTAQPTAGTGTITMNPTTGAYTYTPATGFTGTTTATYTLCNGSPVVCSTAAITVTVFPTLVANPDGITTPPSTTATGTLTTNDGGIVGGATYSTTVTQLPSTTGTITVNPATGNYTFTPNPAYTGSATTTYTICNTTVNPVVCSSTTITIIVGNVPVAVKDGTTTIQNTPVSGNAGTNDTGASAGNGPTFTAGPVTAGTGTLTMNPTTGAYTYTPATGFTGTTTASYTLCNLSSPPCSNTSITFTVFPTLTANPDVVNTTPGTPNSGTLTTNDGGIVTGATYSTTVTQVPPTTGTITVNPATGNYTFTPNPSYTGSTTTTYTICNTSVNPVVCSNTTITINVFPNPAPVNDATTTIVNTPVNGNAGTNDGGTTGGTFTTAQPTAGTGTITMNPATGQYTFTPAAGFTGTTAATYTLCNGAPVTCATAVISVTVFPALAANPDGITTPPSTTATGTLTTNDGGIVAGGTYSTSVTQVPTTTGTITVNPTTGTYTFIPSSTFTGSTTTTYTICNTSVNPNVCSTTTITIIVGNVPVAVADGTTTILNTPVSGNAGTNDTGAGAGNSPVFTSGPVTAGTGTLTMNPTTGAYTFTPATGFTGTTTATYTLCNLSSPPCSTTSITFTVFPALVANPDVVNTTPGTVKTGTVTTNDGGIVAGATYSTTITQLPSTTGTITVNPATGNFTFTPNPSYTGSTTTTYTICNTSVNPVVCSNTTITINVFPNPAPVNDATTTIVNTPVNGNAGTNDGGTTGGTFTTAQPTAGTGTMTMNPATGQYTFTPATGFTGTTSATYTLCNGAPVTCATAVITVTVFPALVANPDGITTPPSTTANGTLTTNDGGIVTGATYSTSVTQVPTTTGTITVNPTTGTYTFTPNSTFSGSTTTTYTICNTAVNPNVCSTTTITIIVGNVPVAVADGTTTILNTPVSGNAGTNDIGAGAGNSPVFTSGPVTAGTGTLTMNPTTGAYTFTPATGFTGTTTATYTLCNLSSPPCSTTSITFTVFPALVANPDGITTPPSTTATGTLTTNDGGVVAGGTYSTTVTQLPPTTGTITVNPATGSYSFTPNATYTGSTTTTYTICNTTVNPNVCSSTTITIIVGNVPVAVADGTTTIENTPVSGNAGTNDTGAGAGNSPTFTYGPVTAGTGTLTMNPTTGAYTFTPATGFTGTTTATYTLCNLSSPPCSTTSITFTVFPAIVANPDVVNTTPGTPNSGTLTTNDGGIVSGATYSTTVTQLPPTTGTITVNPATGNYTFTPNPSYTGSTTTTYTICNTSVNPIVCSNTTITINVFPNPAPVNDATTTIENTPVAGNAGSNDGGTTGGTFSTGQPTSGSGSITMDPATGQYTFTPATGFTGTTTATYTLCNGAPVTCATAVITVTVFPTLVANPDGVVTPPGTTTTGTLTTNDGGIVPGGTYSVTVTQLPPSTGTITVDPSTGGYTLTPNPAYTGSTTTTYTVCNTAVNPVVCSSTTITIIVGNQPSAVADATTTIENTPVSGDASANDVGGSAANGPVFTSGPVTAGTGTLTMNPATGQYTFTPATGFTGTTVATYTLCNLSSPPCSTTSITFTVFPALVANPDGIVTTPTTTATGTLTTNDGGVVTGGTYSTTVTQLPPTTGTITVDPATGSYTFVPNTSFTGTTSTTYTICNTAVNPNVCSSTTITIGVSNAPVAVTDATTTIEDTPVSGDASINDVGGSAASNPTFTSGPVTAGTGTLTMDPATGQYTFTPATGFTGTTVATYTLCNLNSPPCASTTITFTVFPTLVANADSINTTPNTTTSGTLTTNDGGVVPGGTYSVTVTQVPPSTGTITIDPATGSYTFVPTTAYTGTTTTTYTICNTAVNPNVCSTASITIIVGTPQIAAAKTVLSTIKTSPTTYQTVFEFNLANLGNTAGNNVQLMDNLNNTFPAPITYTVAGISAGTPLTTNTAYDGNTIQAMLSGTNTLMPAQAAVVTLTVNFSPNGNTLPGLSNAGFASTSNTPDPNGSGPHTSTDSTQAGTNPDPNGNGNPNEPGENTPTNFGQQIAASKTASALTKVNTNDFQTVFTFNVANVGPVTATNIQLTDNLNNAFPAPMTYTVVGLNANTPLTANAGFNGNTDIALLGGSNTLNSGANALVTLTVNFSTNSSTVTSLSNIGIASTSNNPDPTGTGPHTSIDTTANGLNPDPDDNGVPSGPGEDTPTHFGQQIGAAKTAAGFTKLNATTFQTVFTFNVTNYGAVAATNVQLTDNLNNTFPAPMSYTVVGLNAAAPLSANAAYNGNTNISLLSGSNTLNTSQSAIVTLTVNFNPNNTSLSSLKNIGIASTSNNPDPNGNGPHTSVDTTAAGTNPDPNGNGNPNEPGENDPTFFGEQIAASKTASALTKVDATTYQAVFTFNVANVGPVMANNIQLVDNLNTTFPTPITYTVQGVTAGTPLTANAGYNGNTNIALLSGSNSMNPSQSAIVTMTVNFTMNNTKPATLTNFGVVSTSGSPDPTGNGPHTSTDTTGTGTNPDPDGDGNPNEPGENNPTQFGQQIGVAKTALPSVFMGNGVSQTTFVFTVQNLGVLPATNVQIVDNLNNAFPAPITYSVASLSSGAALTTDAVFNGNTSISMLTGTNTLPVGASETVTLVVNYTMNGSTLTSLYNSAVATTTGPGGELSTDTTNTGTNPDPNGNGNPNEPGENEPTVFTPATDPGGDIGISIPQGFSPNGDNVNDFYVIQGITLYPNNTLTILNRWGNVVYKKDGYDNTWDGKTSEGVRFGGDELPEGTYFFILEYGTGLKPSKGYIYLSRTIK